ncbi:fimbrial protein [Enterobacter cloacae]
MAQRIEFAGTLGHLLHAFTGEHVGEPRLLICLYGPELLHVDLKFVTLDMLTQRVEEPAVLFTRDHLALEQQLAKYSAQWPDMTSYGFPLTSSTSSYNFTSGNYTGWNTQLYLTPISTASSVVIKSGSLFASLVMRQVGSNTWNGGDVHTATFTWNLYANNDVVVPTGGCDVSARDVTVTLPEYPGSVAVPVTVRCAQNQRIAYYLSGTTADSANSIFTNTASALPAQGIGVQMTRNGAVVPANSNVSMGTVGTSPVNLGLTATYARTSGQVTAGNVQAIIGVSFVYL